MLNKLDKNLLKIQADEDSHYMNVLHSYLPELYTCLRPPRPSGALLVAKVEVVETIYVDQVILGGVRSGYNSPTCKDEGHCMMVEGHCVRNIHAEVNALLTAAKLGYITDNSTLYSWNKPCYGCTVAAIQAGVKRIVYRYIVYDEDRTKQALVDNDVVCEQYTGYVSGDEEFGESC